MSERGPGVTDQGPKRRNAVLWLFAFILLGYSLRPAWAWVQETWYEMNHAAPTWADRGEWAVKEVGPLVCALFLMAVLWRVLGPPFSLQRDRRPSATGDETAAGSRRPQEKALEPLTEIERRLDLAGDALRRGGGRTWTVLRAAWLGFPVWARRWARLLWVLTFSAVIAAAGWALLCVACAAQVSGWPMTEADDIEILTWGFVPIGVAACLALVLWGIVGPPFRRPPK